MQRRYVSFDEVKMRVSMEQVLWHYGLGESGTTRKGDELILNCVFHENDTTPSLKINTAKNIFHCFGCDAGGDVIQWVVLKEGLTTGDSDRDRREAALLLQGWFHLARNRSTKTRRRTTKQPSKALPPGETAAPAPGSAGGAPEQPAREDTAAATAAAAADPVNPPLTFTFRHLDATHPYLPARGLTPETVATFGLGYHAGKGIMAGRLVIPIHNEQGELVAYAGRFPGEPPGDTPKYLLPPQFRKSLVLFNFHRAREHAGDGLIVVEGFFSVFDLWQKGRKNVVAVMGSTLSLEQERLVVATVGSRGRVLLAFDPDEAGRKGMQDAATRLASQVFVRTVERTG